MQHVGMADQHGCAGVLQDVVDLFRLEMPVHRYAVGAEPHRRIGSLDERDVVAHQDANGRALFDAKSVQPTRDTRGTVGDLGMITTALAGNDAAVEGGGLHCLLLVWRRFLSDVIPGRCAASSPESRDSGSGPSDHPGMMEC